MGRAEGLVEDRLYQKSKELELLCYKFTAPGRKGVPDRLIIGRGHVVFIETKSLTGRLSLIQRVVTNRMRRHGADVRKCHTKEEVDAFLAEAASWPKLDGEDDPDSLESI